MKAYLLNILGAIVFLFISGPTSAQCITIACPADITVPVDSASCGAVVNYVTYLSSDTCNRVSQAFNFTNTIASWVVPAGVSSIIIKAHGAEGGFNSQSQTPAGLGAVLRGTFNVTPGSELKILVGEQPSAVGGNGGGGGSFVVDELNNPLIIAGGGGGSANGGDSPSKHGQAVSIGGTGGGQGGTGGTMGRGGTVGLGFQSGAGGGLLTNGATGWTLGTAGSAFINGGSGGIANGPARGGFGGGGSGSSYVVGGGGGGYSGGGSGGNASAGVGGGGGSYNGGSNQVNIEGANSGHGFVEISYFASSEVSMAMIDGLASGAQFPVGTTVVSHIIKDNFGNIDTCSFNVTVVDDIAPTFTLPANVSTCIPEVYNIGVLNITDNCSIPSITYSLSGATTGTGIIDASGTTFNAGATKVIYTATDQNGNTNIDSLMVMVNPDPTISIVPSVSSLCVYSGAVQLTATPTGGAWFGFGVVGNVFNPLSLPPGSYSVGYTYTNTFGCTDSASVNFTVNECLGFGGSELGEKIRAFPNPSNNEVTVDLGHVEQEILLNLLNINGQLIYSSKYSNTQTIKLEMEPLPLGVYFMQVTTKTDTSLLKLVKN
jgi:hypothetical protein